MHRKILVLSVFIIIGFMVSCSKEEATENLQPNIVLPIVDTINKGDTVKFDLENIPYTHLSDYNFYLGALALLSPNERVLPYDLINALFSDYAQKSRFVWMPKGVSATYDSAQKILNFPEGTVMIKNFYYDHVLPNNTRKIIETRLIYKKNDKWVFADYTWNEEQTEANFTLEGSNVPVEWLDENNTQRSVNFRIPAGSECFTCHKLNNDSIPIGPKPQNLNKLYNYSTGSMNQLGKWVEVGYLESYPSDINTVVSWTDTSQTLKDRVRGYLDINCSHCHQEGSHCSYRSMRFAYSETALSEYNMGICEEPQEFIGSPMTHIIARGSTIKSVLYFRINSTEAQFRMPLLGRTLVHDEAVVLLANYINSLSPICD